MMEVARGFTSRCYDTSMREVFTISSTCEWTCTRTNEISELQALPNEGRAGITEALVD